MQYWLSKEIGSVPQCLRPPTADRSDGIAAINLEAFGGPLLVMAAGEEETLQTYRHAFLILRHNPLIADNSNLGLLQSIL